MKNNKIKVYDSYLEFKNAISEKYNVLQKKINSKEDEYKSLNRILPKRIKFDELDLQDLKIEMLRIHKTLQWRKFQLDNDILTKARFVAIAGICEMIKDEFTGNFWNLYKSYIGWDHDSYVYDNLWEVGFHEIGILLIKNYNRREFVQSLILESGIPKSRSGDLIRFFIIYWRYFRDYEKIEQLILDIKNNEIDFWDLPKEDVQFLREIIDQIEQYTTAFALTVEKLGVIFSYIENSDKILSDCIDNYINEIILNTGIDPISILRDKRQLINLYKRIIGVINPYKLKILIQKQPPGEKIKLPSGKSEKNNKYHKPSYGIYTISETKYTCLPSTAYTLNDLEDLPYDKIIKGSNVVILKSESVITVMVNSKNRNDLVREFYNAQRLFKGYIFFKVIQPAEKLIIRTSNKKIIETIVDKDDFKFRVNLKCSYKKKIPNLYLEIKKFRIKNENLANQKLLIHSDFSEFQMPLQLFKHGVGEINDEIINVENPSPDNHRLFVVDNNEEPVRINYKLVEYEFFLDKLMLFSPASYQIFPTKEKTPHKYAPNELILYCYKKISTNDIQIYNLSIQKVKSCGDYNIFLLRWRNKSDYCKLVFDDLIWIFDKPLEINIQLTKTKSYETEGLIFNNYQGKGINDFELKFFPFFDESIISDLYLNIIVNDEDPYQIAFQKINFQKISGCYYLTGTELQQIIDPVWSPEKGNSRIEISICSVDLKFDTKWFYVFPELRIEYPDYILEGDTVFACVTEENENEFEVDLFDENNDSTGRLNIIFNNNQLINNNYKYHHEYKIELPKTKFNIEYTPMIYGVKLIDKVSKVINDPFDLYFHDIINISLIISFSDFIIKVNEIRYMPKVKLINNLYIFSLEDIKPYITKYHNTIKILTGDLLEIKSFNIFYNVKIFNFEIINHLINGMINGKCEACGPEGSSYKIKIYGLENNDEKILLNEKEYLFDGKKKMDYINFPVTDFSNNFKMFLARIAVNENSDSEYDYEQYDQYIEISSSGLNKDIDYNMLRENVIELTRQDKYFQAYGCAIQALKIAVNNDEKKWMQDFIKEIKFFLVKYKIYSITNQTQQVLEKDYNIKF